MIRIAALVVGTGVLAACAAQFPITRLVRVTHTIYLPIPPALLVPCKTSKLKATATNGDLLSAYLNDKRSLAACNTQLHQIGTLKAPPSKT